MSGHGAMAPTLVDRRLPNAVQALTIGLACRPLRRRHKANRVGRCHITRNKRRKNMVCDNKDYSRAIWHHYVRCWTLEPEIVNFNRGPITDLSPDFGVLRFAPNKIRSMW